MYKAATAAVLPLICVSAIGCKRNSADNGPFGPPDHSPLLAQFAGHWIFDFEKTLAAQKAAGATDDEIAHIRKLYKDNPQLGPMHPDLAIAGNVAVGVGRRNEEYRFFALHTHGDTLCGKAWHHEDRFDPGDMSKCYVRLRIVNGDLHLDVNMVDGPVNINDPDLAEKLPVEVDASKCEADTNASKKPGDWVTNVFTRGS